MSLRRLAVTGCFLAAALAISACQVSHAPAHPQKNVAAPTRTLPGEQATPGKAVTAPPGQIKQGNAVSPGQMKNAKKTPPVLNGQDMAESHDTRYAALKGQNGNATVGVTPAMFLAAQKEDEQKVGESEETEEEREEEDSFTPGLEIEVEIESAYELSKNFDLDDDVSDDLAILEPEINVSFLYLPVDWFEAKFKVGLIREFALLEEGEKEDRDTALEVNEANIKFKNIYDGLGLQLGRRKFRDERRWLYDEELDAVLAFYEAEDLLVELSASREEYTDRDLLNEDEKRERISNYILFADYQASDQIRLNGYVVARDDHRNEEGTPVLIGVRSTGTLFDPLDHWFEFAYVTGEDGDTDIRGFALDTAATYRLDLPLNPYLSLGYAFGSGDSDPNDGTDKAFRQTGLQKNEGKFAGIPRFKYYGEAFDPELSNLHIFTAGIGLRPFDTFSIDFVYHYYRQDEIADELRDAAFELEPNQDDTRRSRDLGSELDVILGFREIFDVEDLGVDLAVGYFFPGDAYRVVVDENQNIFKDADGAFFVRFEVAYAF